MSRRIIKKFSDNSSEATNESDFYGEGIIKHSKKKQKMSGGKIKLSKSLKKIGSTFKNTFNDTQNSIQNIGKQASLGIDTVKTGFENFGKKVETGINKGVQNIQNFGENVVKEVGEYTDVVLHGRNDYPPKVRELIKEFGEKKIKSIIADRTPVPELLTGALNVISLGAFKKRLSRTPYDELFHLRLDITFEDNSVIAVEKNEVINMYKNPKKLKGSEQININNIPFGITLNKLLEGGQKIQGNKFFNYSAYNNNCQDFIIALLKGSNIGTEQDYNFIKQNTASLFKGDSFLRKFSNTVTDLGGKVNEITTGAGITNESIIQSIIFNKNNWTKRKAINWLKKHNFTGLECDEKENTLRFRQIEPSKEYNYVTKKLPNNVELIIAYKKILPNNKYNKMPKKHIEYDSDSDSSDEEIGISRENKIVRKLKDIAKEIEEHQSIHGGKIRIGKQFKKLGSTIKKGFENEIADYVTAKKGGLASDVITYGLPAASSALLGGLATAATGGNPVAGVAASALGSKLGSLGATELKKQTGTGIKRKSKPNIMSKGDLVHIDIESHNASEGTKNDTSMKGGKLKRTVNASLEQLIESHRNKEEKELLDAMKTFYKDRNLEKGGRKKREELPKYARKIGTGVFVKGSQEAKEHMAKIRAMKGKK